MIYRGLGILTASFILTACGGSSSSSDPVISPDLVVTPPVKEVFTPNSKSIESIAFVDALNKPLASADVVFTPVSQVSSFAVVMADTSADQEISCDVSANGNYLLNTTDTEGGLELDGLVPGTYQVKICKGDIKLSMQFTVLSSNAATAALIAAPLTVDDEGNVAEVPSNSIIVAVSGVIYSDEGVVANAQVAVSGGTLTNGAITTAITDENGFYSIVINVNKSKLTALQSATVQVVAEGFESLNIEGQDFTQFGAFSGVNIKLTAVTDDVLALVYEETFEVLSSGATCGEWTSEVLITEFDEFNVSNVVNESNDVEASEPESLWHTHTSGLDVINQAYLANLVSLAPNDNSAGKVPDPIEGLSACWYGKTLSDGGIEEGNFLNESGEGDAPSELGGGRSASGHAGAIISPRIDFSAETTPLALTFKTWWEIEAVNPNENGFDLMSVEYQIEGEEDWVTFARLNPLADPVGIDDLESLPYSSTGFNRAPLWLEQAPISLNSLAGEVFKLRFTFVTKDELYNGFRGWLLDDVKISHIDGTFPLWNEVDRVLDAEALPGHGEVNEETNKTEFKTNLSVRSLDSVSIQLRMYSFEGLPLSEPFAIQALAQGEVQDVQIDTSVDVPEAGYRVMVELVDASGQIKTSFSLWGAGFDFEDENPS